MDVLDLSFIERFNALAKRVDDHVRRPHPASSDTPRPGFVPRGAADGTIDPGWLPDTSGPTFPPAPQLYQRHFHTARMLDYAWDGTRWLTTQEHTHAFGFPRVLQSGVDPATGATVQGQVTSGISAQSLVDQRYRQRWHYLALRTTTFGVNDGANYWRVQVWVTGTTANRLALIDITTQTDALGVLYMRTPAITAESVVGDHLVYVNATTVGDPGSITVVADLKYRLIG